MMAEYKDRLSANGILPPDAGIIGGDARSLDMAARLLYRVYRALSRSTA